MAGSGMLQRLWLTRLSRPAGDRIVHRHVLGSRPARVIELGLGTLVRTERMLRSASAPDGGPLHYVGLDRFEGRSPSDPPGVSLKEAHRRLHKLAKVQLVPGNLDTSLARLCNHLGIFDLVIVSADNDERHLERCWFFLQRITGPRTVLLRETPSRGGSTWGSILKPKIDELAARSCEPPHRRAG